MADLNVLLGQFNAASERLRRAGGKNGPGAEGDYKAAYDALVKVGARVKLRGKYRG